MSKLHSDATVIDRIGRAVVQDHFSLTRQAIWLWRTKGVPEGSRRPLALLGAWLGIDVSELGTSVESAASSAVPA